LKRGEIWTVVDRITTVQKRKLGKRIGKLAKEDEARLNRAMMVLLGLAG
jgi:mRNA-degrading endonuclease toxin of MazEF toxin-antitoxin module